jgi:hypothetical protein
VIKFREKLLQAENVLHFPCGIPERRKGARREGGREGGRKGRREGGDGKRRGMQMEVRWGLWRVYL